MTAVRVFVLIVLAAAYSCAQSDLEKMVETERAFAKMAAEQGTKAAFLKFMAPDAVVFDPEKISAREVWTARQDSSALLSWAPNYADISANGLLGYTTGNWEWRQSRDDEPTAFGNFFTIWLRQPSGQYRWVLDFGVGRSKPEKYSTDLTAGAAAVDTAKPPSAAEFATGFFTLSATRGLKKAYEKYAADDVRFLRQNAPPGAGQKALSAEAAKISSPVAFAKRSVFFETADLAYVSNTYQTIDKDGVSEKGNSVQVWKFKNGRWQIVFDILKRLPAK
jgi:ketosteroid isomerase-like protein